jgi:membrane protein DedA with SNARE-associated domain
VYYRIAMLHEWLQSLATWYLGALESGGYPLIALLMAVESSIVPLPSEVVIPPAAWLAHTRGNLSLPGIVVAGTVGSWAGAAVMYWGARLIGRPLLMRYGRYVLIPPQKISDAEVWANRFGLVGVFIARLLLVIRHLIGIPAGIVRMDFLRYSLATLAGSAIWCSVLAWLGVTMGRDPVLMAGSLHRIALWLGGFLLVVGSLYYFLVHRQIQAGRRSAG